jgi:hypothetical protein
MSERESTQQEHLRQIPQAEFVAQPAQHDLEYDVSRKLEVVERSARSFIRLAATADTTEHLVTEISGAIQLSQIVRLAMRTDHRGTVGNSE